MSSKAELRKKFKSILKKRCADSGDQGALDSQKFSHGLISFFKTKKGSWGAFYPLPDEPPILSSLSQIEHIEWFFPRVSGEIIEFSNGKKTQTHSIGFTEPSDGEVRAVNELDGFLIPGLAFDRTGHRLGRGKGYYDRSLDGSRGLRVGLCYQEQLIEKLDVVESHDLAMNYILTENEAVACRPVAKGS